MLDRSPGRALLDGRCRMFFAGSTGTGRSSRMASPSAIRGAAVEASPRRPRRGMRHSGTGRRVAYTPAAHPRNHSAGQSLPGPALRSRTEGFTWRTAIQRSLSVAFISGRRSAGASCTCRPTLRLRRGRKPRRLQRLRSKGFSPTQTRSRATLVAGEKLSASSYFLGPTATHAGSGVMPAPRSPGGHASSRPPRQTALSRRRMPWRVFASGAI